MSERKLKSEIIESLKAPQMQVATVTLVYQIIRDVVRRAGDWIKANWKRGEHIHLEVEKRKAEAIEAQIKNGFPPNRF
jgi:hypothetical protein